MTYVSGALTIANDLENDGQVGIQKVDGGVQVIVLPRKHTFPAATILSNEEARAIGYALLEATK